MTRIWRLRVVRILIVFQMSATPSIHRTSGSEGSTVKLFVLVHEREEVKKAAPDETLVGDSPDISLLRPRGERDAAQNFQMYGRSRVPLAIVSDELPLN